MEYISEEVQFGDDELKLAKALRVSCWLNGAACSLKLNDFHEAIKLCSKVISLALTRKEQSITHTQLLAYSDYLQT